MLIYYVNLLIILGLAYPLCVRKPAQDKKLLYLCATFGFMFLLSSARYGIGHDYRTYLETYHDLAGYSIPEIFAGSAGSMEKGYLLLCKLLSLIGLNGTAFYMVMALLCLAPVIWFIYRYSPNVWLSTWLYATLTFFYGTMNFIRQNLALSILLLGYPLLRKRKVWAALCYVGVTLLAATFHITALFMLPVLLVCYLPANTGLYIGYGAVTLVLYLTSHQILELVTKYAFSRYVDTIYLNTGLSIKFLVVPALILLLVLCFKTKILQRYRDGALLINMTLYGALIWLFVTRHFILERFSLYVYVYILLSVPMATECMKPSAEVEGKREALYRQMKEKKSKKSGNARYQALLDKYQKLNEDVRTRWVLYWCLIAAVLVVTFIYNVFGMTDGTMREGRIGFHGVFPYRSLFGWINKLP